MKAWFVTLTRGAYEVTLEVVAMTREKAIAEALSIQGDDWRVKAVERAVWNPA